MTEKEKMLEGMLYDANYDKELEKERLFAKDLCHEYNSIKPSLKVDRDSIISKLFGSTKNNFEIVQPFFCDYGYNIHIGENLFFNYNCVILDCAKVTFGDNVFVGPNCGFYTAGHPIDFKTRNKGLEYAKPITVEDNVWIGGNVVVLAGVTIGSGSVVAGGSVVTKDVPKNVVVAGNPCRVIKEIDNK